MHAVNLADAKAQLSALVQRAADGETITILRRGKEVARLGPPERKRKPIDVEMLRKLTDGMQESPEVVIAMRNDYRY